MNKIYILRDNNECIFHDPGPEMIPIFRDIDPHYRILSIRPGSDFVPKFQALRKNIVHLKHSPFDYDTQVLLEMIKGNHCNLSEGDSYTALDLLYAVSLMALRNCSLCGWHCGVNRFERMVGRCGLGSNVFCRQPFIHIAEEPVINPSLTVNLGGCALRCRYCIDHSIWNTSELPQLVSSDVWNNIRVLLKDNEPQVNTFQFTNPTESLHGVIRILMDAPNDFCLPLVMNAHLYGSLEFYQIANLITDVWLLDYRYGNDDCAKSLSLIDNYIEYSNIGMSSVCNNVNKVIVRILALPGHYSCCHAPAIEALSTYSNHISVSVLDQFVPEHEAHLINGMNRRTTKSEIEMIEQEILRHKLHNILDTDDSFWRQ
ncbi:MAG: hypothetical protein AB2L22_13270 [Syntrophales bacterium]